MKNFIKEGKSGFDFVSVSSSSKVMNANRLQTHALAYNLFMVPAAGVGCRYAEAAHRYHPFKTAENCRKSGKISKVL